MVKDVIKETVSIAAGVSSGIGAVYVAGQVGLSAVGITTGLAVLGGTMVGGLAVVASLAIGVYAFFKWLFS